MKIPDILFTAMTGRKKGRNMEETSKSRAVGIFVGRTRERLHEPVKPRPARKRRKIGGG